MTPARLFLAAQPAASSAPMRVKPLEWHNFDAWTHWAEGACGTYHVEERNGYWQVELRVGGLVHGVTATDDTTPADLDAAKAAAQADYEARILAALEPAPDMAELVEALRWYGEVGRLARLITREGDAGRAAISADGGQRAAAALAKIKEQTP